MTQLFGSGVPGPVARRCLAAGALALAVAIARPAAAIYPYVEFSELAHTADLIFVGEVTSAIPRLHAGGRHIVTDVTYQTVMVIHQGPAVRSDVATQVTLTFAGGQIGDRSVTVSETPHFEVGQTYVIFAHMDGQSYINPVVAGPQGLFGLTADPVTGEWHPRTEDGRAITGVSDGRLQLSEPVRAIEGGMVQAAPPILPAETGPVAGDAADSAWAESARSAEDMAPLTLQEFVDEIHAALLAPAPARRVLRGSQFEPADPIRSPAKAPADGPAGTEPRKNGLRPGTTGAVIDPEHMEWFGSQAVMAPSATASLPDDATVSAGARGGDGTRAQLCACGAFDLFIVMEQVPSNWWEFGENDQAMFQFNQFMDIYRYVDDDGSWGNNSENEFAGYPTSQQMMNQYGQGWSPGALAVTWTAASGCSCCEIVQADVMFNPAFTWWQNLSDTLDQFGSGRVLYRPTVMHELGHSWGLQRGDCVEDYSYNQPTVMHAYYDNIIEDGWGIHPWDAYAIRELYDDQTSILGLRDLGVESYFVSSGSLSNSTTNSTTYFAGDPITLQNVLVENNSNFAVSGVRIRFFLSTNNIISPGDLQMGSFWEWASFGAETFNISSYSTTIPNVPAGTYFVGAIVTANGAAYEGDALMYNNATYFKNQITVLAPPNNACANATTIGLGTTTGITGAGTTDGSATCGSSNSSPDVWYRFVAPCTGNLKIDTCGSSYDTVVSVHSACTGTTANQLACNDDCDGFPCGPTSSCLTVPVTVGTTYRIRVAGFNGASGSFVLRLGYDAPANNSCANAPLIDTGTTAFSTCGATTDGPTSCFGTAQNDIWYRHIASCDGDLTVSLCGSTYDTMLVVYDEWGCPPSLADQVACADNSAACTPQSQVTIPTTIGTGYLIRVGGAQGASGPGDLTVSCAPSNDLCANAQAIGNGTFVGTTAGGAGNDGSASCGTSSSTADVWYKWTAPCTGNLRLETCGAPYDTVLSVHTGCPASVANQIACNDDCLPGGGANCTGTTASCLIVPVVGGEEYIIRVSGYNGAVGQYTLRVSNSPLNDSCTNRQPVTDGVWSFSTCGAFGDAIPGCTLGLDVWYQYVASCTGDVTVSLCNSEYDTRLGVFQGTTCREPFPTLLACNDDACGSASEVTFNAVQGTTYLIGVGGAGTAVGAGELSISCGIPAAQASQAWSGKTHTTVGDCYIALNMAGEVQNGNVTTESRQGGITDVIVAFDVAPGTPGVEPVLIDEQVGCPPGAQEDYVPYTGAALVNAYVDGTSLVLNFSPALENGRTYRIEFGPELTTVAGQAIEIRGLVADVNSTGTVNALDRSTVIGVWTGATGFSCATDVNRDGSTNALDRSIVIGVWTGANNCAP